MSNAAIALGYRPAKDEKQCTDESLNPQKCRLKNGNFKNYMLDSDYTRPVEGKGMRDCPDDSVRSFEVYDVLKSKDETNFEGVPDKHCTQKSEHHLATGWALGSKEDNKLLAHPEGSSLCDLRDIILLHKIMCEPPNLNASKPAERPMKSGMIPVWGPAHARPTLISYKNHIRPDGLYVARLVGLCAFNRAWILGRQRLAANCDLRSEFLHKSIRWDAVAMAKSADAFQRRSVSIPR